MGAAFACMIGLIIVCCVLAFLALKFGSKLPRYYSDGRVEENGVVTQEATEQKPANS